MKKLILILFIFSVSWTNIKSQCLTADMMVLIDWSASEQGNEDALIIATMMFALELPINDEQLRMGMIIFSNGNLDTVPLTGNKNNLLYGIYKLSFTSANGGTQINNSLETANYFLNNSREVPKIIVVISDGEITDLDNAITTIEKMKTTLPLSVRAIQVGGFEYSSEENFKNLTRLTGNSKLVEVLTPDGLVEALKKMNLCN